MPGKPLSPAKRKAERQAARRWTPGHREKTGRRARRRWKPPSPAPKARKAEQQAAPVDAPTAEQSTRAGGGGSAIARAKKRYVKPNSRPHSRISRQPQPMTTRAKRPSPRPGYRPRSERVKQQSRQLTRNKWFSESQAPYTHYNQRQTSRIMPLGICSHSLVRLVVEPGFRLRGTVHAGVLAARLRAGQSRYSQTA